VFGATISDEAMICPGAMLLEAPAPRAATLAAPGRDRRTGRAAPSPSGLGATIGAGAVIAPGVAARALVAGNPARPCGWVCACGTALDASLRCPACSRAYDHGEQGLVAIPGEGEPA
jgi:acetyltransferase-like isoleucine patch superfamily enzyme